MRVNALRLWSLLQVCIALGLVGLLGCAERSGEGEALGDEAEVTGSPSPATGSALKGDSASTPFPAERDLALLFPLEDASALWLDHLPREWLDEVSEALKSSELAEDISLESWEEDWRLVSARVTPCQPLGQIADPEELDALCWPQLRLVWQPVIEELTVLGVVRPFYADDRAIHTLFFASPEHPALSEALELAEGGVRWADWSVEARARFERARDEEARALLEELETLRGAEGPYDQLKERPELYSAPLTGAFFETLHQLLNRRARPEQLSELTAFSLPLGRSPAAADLWSFVAFTGRGGQLTQSPLTVRDASTGEALFSFPRSEDVTTGHGDPELTDALVALTREQREALFSQVITDTDELATKVDRINDPYQTTVAHTTCASCHRANNINFNFHNLSYLEDQSISVSPRVRRDVVRDLKLARLLWQTGTLTKP